ITAYLSDFDAEVGSVAETGQKRRAFEQRFSGNATNIEANAAEELLLDAGGLVAELRRLDGSDIPARTRPHDNDVEALVSQSTPRGSGFQCVRRPKLGAGRHADNASRVCRERTVELECRSRGEEAENGK